MNFKEAKTKVIVRKIIGLSIALPAVISTFVSLLKMLYFRLDDGTRLGSEIARPFKRLVGWIYDNSHSLEIFWEHSPTPDQSNLISSNNITFIIIYMAFFVGLAFLSSSKKLSNRLDKISEKIEDQLIEESMKGRGSRTRDEIEKSTEVVSSSIFSQLHQLYLAPIITAVIGAILIKILGT